jgi:hypothetical protein
MSEPRIGQSSVLIPQNPTVYTHAQPQHIAVDDAMGLWDTLYLYSLPCMDCVNHLIPFVAERLMSAGETRVSMTANEICGLIYP